MRRTFDQSVPVHEQLLRITEKRGHKHGAHAMGPSRVALKAQRKAKFAEDRKKSKNRRKKKAAIAAYWAGQFDEYPK